MYMQLQLARCLHFLRGRFLSFSLVDSLEFIARELVKKTMSRYYMIRHFPDVKIPLLPYPNSQLANQKQCLLS